MASAPLPPPVSDSELASLFARLRAAPPPPQVAAVAAALPARLTARLAARPPEFSPACLRWALFLGPSVAACAVVAMLRLEEARQAVLGLPFLSAWLFSLVG